MTERDVPWLQAGSYAAAEDRLVLSALLGARPFVDIAPSTSPVVDAGGGHGVIGTGMAVTAGAGTSVDVALGAAAVRGTQQSDQHVYLTSNDATKNLSISAADSTNPRKDLVVTRVKDNEYGISGDTGPLEVVTGTPTGGLTAGNATGRPTPPENALVLAEVFVPAGAASSASYTITDLRTFATAIGGVQRCSSSATYPNPAYPGQMVYDLALKRYLSTQDGTNWGGLGRLVSASTGTAHNGIGTSFTQVNNLNPAAITATGDRRLKITAKIDCRQRTGTGLVTVEIFESTGVVSVDQVAATISTDAYHTFAWSAEHTPAAGTRTYRLRVKTSANTVDTIGVVNATLLVEDIGPA